MNRKEELKLVLSVINEITADMNKGEIQSDPIKLIDIDFQRVDMIDATKVNCINFRNKGDRRIVSEKDLVLNFGNMVSGYAFDVNGVIFLNSETAYISGIYSKNTDICIKAQYELAACNNGLTAKKKFRYRDNEYTANTRNDWETFNMEWMKYVIWQKIQGNDNFRNLLLATPDDSMIVEDTSFLNIKCSTAKLVWGAENLELKKLKDGKLKELRKRLKDLNIHSTKKYKQLLFNNMYNYGSFVGQNLMGKILTYFRICLRNGIEPQIYYILLNTKNIHLLGKKIGF